MKNKIQECIDFERTKTFVKKTWKLFCIIATIVGFVGCNLKDMLEKDWQQISETKNNEALELYNSGKYDEAIDLYDDVISLEDKDIQGIDIAYFNRGMAYYKKGDYAHAIGDFTNAINIKPRTKYFANRANAYNQIGDIEKAIEDNLRATTSIGE